MESKAQGETALRLPLSGGRTINGFVVAAAQLRNILFVFPAFAGTTKFLIVETFAS